MIYRYNNVILHWNSIYSEEFGAGDSDSSGASVVGGIDDLDGAHAILEKGKSDELSSTLTTHSRSRQMDAANLDAKIVKSLKKQEDKREKRTQRKKEVRLNMCF